MHTILSSGLIEGIKDDQRRVRKGGDGIDDLSWSALRRQWKMELPDQGGGGLIHGPLTKVDRRQRTRPRGSGNRDLLPKVPSRFAQAGVQGTDHDAQERRLA